MYVKTVRIRRMTFFVFSEIPPNIEGFINIIIIWRILIYKFYGYGFNKGVKISKTLQ